MDDDFVEPTMSYFEREEGNFANFFNRNVSLEYFSQNEDDVELEIEQEEI